MPAVAVAVVAFAAARLALQPGIEFWDTGEFQTVGPVLGTAHPTGYPTYVLLGWLASVLFQPFGDPAFRMNLLSACLVAVAAGVIVDLVRSVTRSAALGMVAGFGLALTPIAWSIGTHADPHALHLAFVAILLRLLVAWQERVRAGGTSADRWLLAATVVFGLSVGNHSLTLLLAPSIGLFVLVVAPSTVRRPRFVLTCVVTLALTVVVVYAELPLRAGPFRAPLVYGTPETWQGFWYVVLGEQFHADVGNVLGQLGPKARDILALTVEQFGILAPLIPIGFLATAVRLPRYALLTGSAAAITCLFAASYENADIGRYYLGPILMAWTWVAVLAGAAAEGAAILAKGRWTFLARGDVPGDARPAGSAVFAGLAAGLLLLPTLALVDPRLAATDRTVDRRAAAWLDTVLPLLAPRAIVISGWSYSTPLWYAQLIEGRRPDIEIVDDRTRLDEDLGTMTNVIEANLGQRPVYLMRQSQAMVPYLEGRYRIENFDSKETGLLIRVIDRR